MRSTDRLTSRVLQWLLRRRAMTNTSDISASQDNTRTHTYKFSYAWAISALSSLPGSDIRVWRSVNTGFMKAFIHRRFFGRVWLRLLYAWEEAAPHLLGRIGQYPMFTMAKADNGDQEHERTRDGMDG
jgi:hypothetical protein